MRWLSKEKQLTLEERNKLLEDEAVEMEKRAGLLEKEAELRKRLLSAGRRCEKAREGTSIWKPGTLKWVLIGVAILLVLILMIRGCA